MTGKEAYEQISQLQRDLIISLETFDRKDNIQQLREQIIHVQNECPHFDENFVVNGEVGKCPYCGRRMA
nr:MAG TPA: zinc-ribbon containing domain protein [Caudoviricetes sp.]